MGRFEDGQLLRQGVPALAKQQLVGLAKVYGLFRCSTRVGTDGDHQPRSDTRLIFLFLSQECSVVVVAIRWMRMMRLSI